MFHVTLGKALLARLLFLLSALAVHNTNIVIWKISARKVILIYLEIFKNILPVHNKRHQKANIYWY